MCEKKLPEIRVDLFKTVKNYGVYIHPSMLITDESLIDVFLKIPGVVQDFIGACRKENAVVPKEFQNEFTPVYYSDVPCLIALAGDAKLIAEPSRLPLEKLSALFLLQEEATEIESDKILEAVHQLGEKLCALQKVDFSLCPNAEILVYISGLRRQSVQEYLTGKREPMPATEALLLDSLHKHGQKLKDMQLLTHE